MPGETKGTRVIALVGPAGAGKTSLAEALLYASGSTDRQGSVASGTSSPAPAPISTAPRVLTNPPTALIATSAPIRPMNVRCISGLPYRSLPISKLTIPPAAPASSTPSAPVNAATQA